MAAQQIRRPFLKKPQFWNTCFSCPKQSHHTTAKKKMVWYIFFFWDFYLYHVLWTTYPTSEGNRRCNSSYKHCSASNRHGCCLVHLFPWFLFILPEHFASSASVTEAIGYRRLLQWHFSCNFHNRVNFHSSLRASIWVMHEGNSVVQFRGSVIPGWAGLLLY